MITCEHPFIDVNGNPVTLIAPKNMEFPSKLVADFGTYCGAGKYGDLLVPDTFYWLKMSPACFIHDMMWEMSDATWAAFHFSNSIFLRNLNTLVIAQSKNSILKRLRLYRAATYYNAVDTKGPDIFWRLKEGRCLD